MNIKEYQNNANRTLVSLGSNAVDGAHMAMGITTELFEMTAAFEMNDKVNYIEEHGDVLWYIAGECKIYNLCIEELFSNAKKLIDFAREGFDLSELVDLHKRELAYGKEMNVEHLKEHLTILLADLIELADEHEFTIEESMTKNINKLQFRFPDKFTQEKALNRDLKTERQILEK